MLSFLNKEMNYFLDDVKVFIVENLQALASVFKDNGRS
jgi:hypothetical protein